LVTPIACNGIPPGLGFAEGRGWVERNVALSNIEELKIRHIVTSNPAIERPVDLGRFLLRLDDCNDGNVAAAMRLLVMIKLQQCSIDDGAERHNVQRPLTRSLPLAVHHSLV
jgi:hypothetical protein